MKYLIKATIPVVPCCTLRANAQHPLWFMTMLKEILQTGGGYDAVWYCGPGGRTIFRVHKIVLAAFSDHMKVCSSCIAFIIHLKFQCLRGVGIDQICLTLLKHL